jgi:hypothetical protein
MKLLNKQNKISNQMLKKKKKMKKLLQILINGLKQMLKARNLNQKMEI